MKPYRSFTVRLGPSEPAFCDHDYHAEASGCGCVQRTCIKCGDSYEKDVS